MKALFVLFCAALLNLLLSPGEISRVPQREDGTLMWPRELVLDSHHQWMLSGHMGERHGQSLSGRGMETHRANRGQTPKGETRSWPGLGEFHVFLKWSKMFYLITFFEAFKSVFPSLTSPTRLICRLIGKKNYEFIASLRDSGVMSLDGQRLGSITKLEVRVGAHIWTLLANLFKGTPPTLITALFYFVFWDRLLLSF